MRGRGGLTPDKLPFDIIQHTKHAPLLGAVVELWVSLESGTNPINPLNLIRYLNLGVKLSAVPVRAPAQRKFHDQPDLLRPRVQPRRVLVWGQDLGIGFHDSPPKKMRSARRPNILVNPALDMPLSRK